jgi:hypothetical protein
LLAARSESTHGIDAFNVARWYARAGDVELTLEWLGRAYEVRSPLLFLCIAYPSFDVVRSEPAYLEMVARMGLPPMLGSTVDGG